MEPVLIKIEQGFISLDSQEVFNKFEELVENGEFFSYLSEAFNEKISIEKAGNTVLDSVTQNILNRINSLPLQQHLPHQVVSSNNTVNAVVMEDLVEPPKPIIEVSSNSRKGLGAALKKFKKG